MAAPAPTIQHPLHKSSSGCPSNSTFSQSAFSQFATEFSSQTSFLQLVTHIHEAYMSHIMSSFQGQSRPFYELVDQWKEVNHRYFPETESGENGYNRNKADLVCTIKTQERDIRNLRDKLVDLEREKIKLEQKYIRLEQQNMEMRIKLNDKEDKQVQNEVSSGKIT